MTAAAEPALDDVLAELGAPALVEVVDERQELLRFGASRITYQHSEQQLRVRVLLIRAGRAVWGVTSTLDPRAMRSLRARRAPRAWRDAVHGERGRSVRVGIGLSRRLKQRPQRD